MRLKHLFFAVLACASLASCELYAPVSSSPSSQISSEEVIYLTDEITSEEFYRRLDEKETFVIFLHSLTCGHCKRLAADTINPYIEKNNVKIDAILFNEIIKPGTSEDEDENIAYREEELKKFVSYFDGTEEFFTKNDEGEVTNMRVPITMYFEEGKLANYVLGNDGKSVTKLLDSYFKK